MGKKTKKSEAKAEGQVEQTTVAAKDGEMESNTQTTLSDKDNPVKSQADVEQNNATEVQSTEKPAPKQRVNRRPYIPLLTEHLESGDLDRKEIIKLVLSQFAEVRKGGIETFVTDLLNPKYSHFKERLVTKRENGKLVFADRLQATAVEVEHVESQVVPEETGLFQPAE